MTKREETKAYLSKVLNTPAENIWELCVDEYIVHGDDFMPFIRMLQEYHEKGEYIKKQVQLTFDF